MACGLDVRVLGRGCCRSGRCGAGLRCRHPGHSEKTEVQGRSATGPGTQGASGLVCDGCGPGAGGVRAGCGRQRQRPPSGERPPPRPRGALRQARLSLAPPCPPTMTCTNAATATAHTSHTHLEGADGAEKVKRWLSRVLCCGDAAQGAAIWRELEGGRPCPPHPRPPCHSEPQLPVNGAKSSPPGTALSTAVRTNATWPGERAVKAG